MCSPSCINFGQRMLSEIDIKNKRIIDIGSYNFNGSMKKYAMSNNPSEYIGVDLQKGPCVDVICDIKDLLNVYKENSFDIVISTELLEHVYEWRIAINNMKLLCKNNGIILITTRSKGFAKHDWPGDHWRFEIRDMEYIFSDCITHIEPDTFDIGVFVKAIKPQNFELKNLDMYGLYNIEYNRLSL